MADASKLSRPASSTLILIVLGMLSAFAPMASDLYLPGFHQLAISFGVGDDGIQNTLSVFFLGLACGALTIAFWLVAALWVTMASVAIIGSNSAAIAMTEAGTDSGSGSALIGVLQFGLAFAASSIVAALQNGTAYPMTGVIFACGLLATVTWMLGRRFASTEIEAV